MIYSLKITFNGQEWFNSSVAYFYYVAPLVLSIIPNSGPLKGGNIISIIGRNFKYSKKILCRFGDITTKGKFVNNHKIKVNFFFCYIFINLFKV